MASLNPAYVFVLDQGSRPSPPLVPNPDTKTLIIDHHFAEADDFPQGSYHVNACSSPPVATSSLLTYEICRPLHDDLASECGWLCALGTHGDLGNTLKWEPPFPDMKQTFKVHPKKTINDAVSLINAPRRTASYDVRGAWDALLAAPTPAALLKDGRLLQAREEVARETERCTHAPPKFSRDGSVAVLRIESAAQVHPIIATRWAGFLNSSKLLYVMVANSGHLRDKINFSCRVARCAKTRKPPVDVDIIASLKESAAQHTSGDLIERMGESFARGHVQASGGIVNVKEFEDLMEVMGVGESTRAKNKEKGASPRRSTQSNTINKYFGTKE